VLLLSTASVARSGAGAGHLPLTTLGDVPLTGRATRWDYASLDATTHRLFLAHFCDSVVTVFDTQLCVPRTHLLAASIRRRDVLHHDDRNGSYRPRFADGKPDVQATGGVGERLRRIDDDSDGTNGKPNLSRSDLLRFY